VKYKIEEICQLTGVDDDFVLQLVRREYVHPASPEANEFDDEDLTRIRLISDLINHLEVNENAVPVILHLIDQIHRLRLELYNRHRD
jgi:chaperone modulatory protein CbpM